MTYILPRPKECNRCGWKFTYGPHDAHSAPVTTAGPTCPKCWDDFLTASFGVGVPVVEKRIEHADGSFTDFVRQPSGATNVYFTDPSGKFPEHGGKK